MADQLKILILEDDPRDVELIRRELTRAGVDFISKVTIDKETFIKELGSFEPDIVLSDFSMPQLDAMTALDIVKSRVSEIPLIVVTGAISEETAVECMLEGAADYVLKSHLAKLGPAVQRTMDRKREHDERLGAEEELKEKLRNISDFNALMVGREQRIVELKQEVNSLLAELGRAPKYFLSGKVMP